ncbi:type II iodothyronine deiodinase [Solea senegalensis]|uniref:Iodothyronine deiodinase n=2 Tax=Solea senegalensis TaxID=28829 RepID=A0AAV6S092_SOLSE|nr:type II iodothyronine deiodinase [Solea senegalensis]
MGTASEDVLVTLQILPGFFSNCLFFMLYDSVVLLKRVVALLSSSRSGGSAEWRRMFTSAGLRSIWNSFLLDAHKQVKLGHEAPNSKVVVVPGGPRSNATTLPNAARTRNGDECHLLDFESLDRPLVVNFGSAT